MQEQLNNLVQEKKLHQKIADKISKLAQEEQAAILSFLSSFRLGINYSKEFLTYLFDISRRDEVQIAKLLNCQELVALAGNENLPQARKMELLRGVLRRKRFPISLGQDSPHFNVGFQGKGLCPQQKKSLCSQPHNELWGIKKIYVETTVENEQLTKDVLLHFKNLPVEYIDSAHQLIKRYSNLTEGKRILVVAEQKGKWLEHCPGTQKHICCNYLVVNNAVNCPFDCTYCYLQTYLNNNVITLYANVDGLLAKLKDFMAKNPKLCYRVGTGEFSDSLALDKATGLSSKLIELFAQQENHLLELKTKSGEVDHLLDIDHKNKTVIAWSVNPEKIVQSDEFGARSLEERLAAAQKVVAAGYKVGFHFDPIIFYPGWEHDYKQVVDLIFEKVKAEHIAWISLGALRYQPELKDIIEQRFPHSRITLGELDVAKDGKIRYFEPIRLEIFKKMHQMIRSHSPEVFIYLCMESEMVWQKSGITNLDHNPYQKYFRFFRTSA